MGFVGVQVKDNDYNLNNLTSNPLHPTIYVLGCFQGIAQSYNNLDHVKYPHYNIALSCQRMFLTMMKVLQT
jgi:hypothetical protein